MENLSFRVDFSDKQFMLVVLMGGVEINDIAMPYCSVSSVAAPNGRVYAVYLRATEPELDKLTENDDLTEMITRAIKVYDVTDGLGAAAKLLDVPVTLSETEFEDEEDDDDDEGEEGEEVEPQGADVTV